MGKIAAKGCVITLEDSASAAQTISSDVTSYEIQYAVDVVEVTGMSDTVHNSIPGNAVIGVTLNCLWNTTASTGAFTVLKGILGFAEGRALTITPESGGPILTGDFMVDGFTVSGSPGGAIQMGAVHFTPYTTTAPTFASA